MPQPFVARVVDGHATVPEGMSVNINVTFTIFKAVYVLLLILK